MAIKTFNIDKEAYEQFSAHCKKHGVSMSKKVENFIKEEISKIKDKAPTKKLTGKKEAAIPQGLHTFSKYC